MERKVYATSPDGYDSFTDFSDLTRVELQDLVLDAVITLSAHSNRSIALILMDVLAAYGASSGNVSVVAVGDDPDNAVRVGDDPDNAPLMN